MRVAFLRMISMNSRTCSGTLLWSRRVSITLNRGQRCAQLVRNIGDEIAPRLLHTLDLGLIVQHRNRAASRHRRCRYIEDASGKDFGSAGHGDVTAIEGVLH